MNTPEPPASEPTGSPYGGTFGSSEPPRADEPRTDPLWADAPRTDAPRTDPPRADAPGAGAPGADLPPREPGADLPPRAPGASEWPGAAGPPPPAGPPPGADAYEPPPLTAFAWRNGFVRPVNGKLLAGVCGALGRGTNTDPILWRVVLAVLTLFGGIGVLVYLLGWIMLPAEGDTASPVEALLGRGRSRTSNVLTIIVGLIALISVGAFFSEPFRPGLLGAVLLGGAALLLLRDQRGRARTATATPPVPGGSMSMPTTEAPTSTTAPLPPTAAQPPFAPHGPFVPPPPAPPPVAYAPVPPRPKPPKPPRSPLGGLTFSLMVLVIGVLALVDLSGFNVPAPAYFAAALTVVGLGLVTGAWIGRGRGLIAVGIIAALGLGAATGASHVPGPGGWQGGTNTVRPTTLSQVESSYGQDAGNLRLDLTDVDFTTAPGTTNIDARVDWGNLTIVVPPNVDVVVEAAVDVGNAEVFDERWNGLGLDTRTVTNYGDDGPGGNQLRIHATVDLGNLEVHR